VTSMKEAHHPLFARLYGFMTRYESAQERGHRTELLSGLSGRVLEVGAGAGTNFDYYPAGVTEVVAVEPEAYLREKATAAATRAPVKVTVLTGTADQLPAPDGGFDSAVACLVLCSVPDQAAALAELRRVLRPGGELRFYEHVLSRKPLVAWAQRLVDRTFWPTTFGGCHTARDTPAAIAAAGFKIEQQRRMWVAPVPVVLPAATHALGRARRS
jgi:ubiquinone/menaquinone biosynthesis C-methylase UbiE